MVRHGATTAEQGMRYAMSLPVATTISGVDSMEVLDQNLALAIIFQAFSSPKWQNSATAVATSLPMEVMGSSRSLPSTTGKSAANRITFFLSRSSRL